MVKVAINAGHGKKNVGDDPGAIGQTGLHEAEVTKEIALLVEAKLKAKGYVTLFIQDGDLADVTNASNNWGANYFISIHCNSFNAAATGVETFAFAPGGIGEKIAKAVQAQLVKATKLANRGVKFAGYYVLKHTKCPAILTEIAFISNPAEEKLMRNSTWKCEVAEAIAQGFMEVIPPAAK